MPRGHSSSKTIMKHEIIETVVSDLLQRYRDTVLGCSKKESDLSCRYQWAMVRGKSHVRVSL